MDLSKANLFVTGGAGTLGRAIARRRAQEGWTGRLTVYSSDTHKHDFMRKFFPDVQYVQGDIRNPETLYQAMCGHDIVIHAAAVKVIPSSEWWSIDTVDVNVIGSQNVCIAAMQANIQHVLGISTDKACHPANAYGASKMLMEKIFQEFARMPTETKFHLVRYGNVLESTGSVIEAWKDAFARGEKIKITDPNMTRFWLSPMQAVQYVIEALDHKSGVIYVPAMPALSIGKLARYVLGDDVNHLWEKIPLRPGEKIHETLVTIEESARTASVKPYVIHPTTDEPHPYWIHDPFEYTSANAEELTEEQLAKLLENG